MSSLLVRGVNNDDIYFLYLDIVGCVIHSCIIVKEQVFALGVCIKTLA